MSQRAQLTCLWSTLIGLVIVGVGFWPVAGYLPPPAANDTAQEIANFYSGDTDGIRIGLVLAFVGIAGWGPFVAVITRQMLRMERDNVLAYLQLVAGAVGWVFLLVPLLVLSVAAFRPDRNPETTQTVHDLGWFLLFMPIVPFVAMAVTIGIATLTDTARKPVFPRWSGYFNIWCGLLFAPGILLTFFKTGAFSYQGLFVYWIPLILFFIWIVVLLWVLRAAVLTEPKAGARRASR